jgi:hypothetical protein
MLLIDKFFTIQKTGSMDEYLADVKEAADQMEEVDVGLPEKVIVYHTLKNLPKEYDMIKQVILNERKPPSYLELESRVLNEEMARRQDGAHGSDAEALAVTYRQSNSRRPYSRGLMNQGGRSGSSYQGSYGSGGPRGSHYSSGIHQSSYSGGFNSNSGGGSHRNYQSRWHQGNFDARSSSGSQHRQSHDNFNRHRQSQDARYKLDSLEQELRSIISKVKDLENKLQREDNDHRRRSSPSQIHNVETDQADEEHFETEIAEDG